MIHDSPDHVGGSNLLWHPDLVWSEFHLGGWWRDWAVSDEEIHVGLCLLLWGPWPRSLWWQVSHRVLFGDAREMAPGRWLKFRLAAWLGANKSSWWTSLHIFTNSDWDHLHFEDQSFWVVGSVPTKNSTCLKTATLGYKASLMAADDSCIASKHFLPMPWFWVVGPGSSCMILKLGLQEPIVSQTFGILRSFSFSEAEVLHVDVWCLMFHIYI